jgi:hypothetical protein
VEVENPIPILFHLGEAIARVRKPSPEPLPRSYHIHHHLEVHTSKAIMRLNQFSRDLSLY